VAAHRISWGSKSAAIAELADELNLGLNSFVFLDDDPVECARMEVEQPEVLTLALPTSDEEIVTFLDRLWMFDGAGATQEDKKRTQLYREERQRRDVRQRSSSLQDFVRGLELKIASRLAEEKDVDRVVQIMERTTQFNTTGLKLRAEDVRQITGSADRYCPIIEVSDRFGDYGKSGLLILRRSEAIWQVELLALSCRVLGRDVEFKIVEELVERARKAGAGQLSFAFQPSARNMPAQSFLRELHRLVGKPQEPVAVNLFSLEELAEGLERRRGSDAPRQAEPAAVPEPELPAQPADALDFKAATRRFSRLVATEYRTVGEIVEALNVRAVRPSRKSVAFEAPRNPTEETLMQIWCEVLRVEQAGVHDNFFELGGHSLLATQVVARVRDRLGVELPLRTMFEAPTIAEIAVRILPEGWEEETIEI
jgi:FkbH-like protein